MASQPERPQHTYLSIRKLSKQFGDFTALSDVSLDIQEGEFVCFLGPSGCGKTTLLRAIAGLDLQTYGSIHQNGADVSNLPPSERDFGIVFQSYALFPNLSVWHNIAYGLENTKMPRGDIETRVAQLLETIGLKEHAKKYPAQLSGGQQQRVALARALAMSPGLLLLDEPLSALDAKVRTHLRHEIKSLQKELGVTTIMVTHDQEEALSMADRIVVMNHGHIEQIGTPMEIYRDPQSLFVVEFIGATNKLPGHTLSEVQTQVGNVHLRTKAQSNADQTPVFITIRPEDIRPERSEDETASENTLHVTVKEMEFLGAFFRTTLHSDAMEAQPLLADFSVNDVRHLGIEPNQPLRVSLPTDCLHLFPQNEGAAV